MRLWSSWMPSLPITAYTTSYFLTARLAARHMIPNRSGVIMTVTALPARMGSRLNGGYGPAHAGKEALTRDLSAELAPQGIRVVGLRPHGMPPTSTMKEVFDTKATALGVTWEQFQEYLAGTTHPRRVMTLDEVANMAVFMASDKASGYRRRMKPCGGHGPHKRSLMAQGGDRAKGISVDEADQLALCEDPGLDELPREQRWRFGVIVFGDVLARRRRPTGPACRPWLTRWPATSRSRPAGPLERLAEVTPAYVSTPCPGICSKPTPTSTAARQACRAPRR